MNEAIQNVMDKLYPNKRISFSSLSENEQTILSEFIKDKNGGFNKTYNVHGEIDEIWLSSEGKRRVKETRDNQHQVRKWLKKNYKWLITTLLSLKTFICWI